MRASGRRRFLTLPSIVTGMVIILFAWAPTAPAQDDEKDTLRVELNKLEPTEGDCRAYLLFENRTAVDFRSMKLDLVMFNAEGIINKRLAVEGGPLPPGKTSVKLFDIQGVGCDAVERVLLNGILACSDPEGERSGCLDMVETASRSSAGFFK